MLEALPHGLLPNWRLLARDASVRVLTDRGIHPILTRLVLEGAAGPFSANAAMTTEATYRIVGSSDGAIHLDMWSTLSAPLDDSKDRQRTETVPSRTAVAGRVFAEHTFTRPFAPPGRRRVTAIDCEGAPGIRDRRPPLPGFDAIARLPEDARALDATLKVDTVPVALGIVHTDSNKHANSLAYLRIFEEAALRRFVALGRGSKVLGRRLEIAYRRPCFAGEELRVAVQAYEQDGGLGIVGVLAEHSQAGLSIVELLARARTYVRMGFDP